MQPGYRLQLQLGQLTAMDASPLATAAAHQGGAPQELSIISKQHEHWVLSAAAAAAEVTHEVAAAATATAA